MYIQQFAESRFPTPDSTTRGRFTVERGCLLFSSGGRGYRAVVPKGTRLEAGQGLVFPTGRQAALGSELVIKGAEGEYGRTENIPPACPKQAMLIGGLE